jgi:hypothetical protein
MAPRAKALPVEDGMLNDFEFQGETYYVRTKYKVGRFLKTLNENPVDALELVLVDASYEKFLDLEITMDEMKDFMDALSNVLSGVGSGN